MSNTNTNKPVCMVIGAGAGIGGNVAKRFAKEGFHSVLCRRSNQHGLDDLIRGIEEEGGTASGFLINVVEPESIDCLLYTSPSPRDRQKSRMPSSA